MDGGEERERERESEWRRRKIERKVFKRVNLSHVLHVRTTVVVYMYMDTV